MAELRDLIVYGNSRLIGDTDASNIVAVSVSGSSITASVGFSGNLTGTASYASNALSASRATSASRADSAASATSATSATKLVGSSGSTSVPVYFDAGVPKVVTAINLANITASTGFKGNLTGTASYASVASQVSAAKASPSWDHFIMLRQAESGSGYTYTTASIKYNTSTKTLTVPNITGTASFAKSASIAISASQAITASYASDAVEKPKQVEIGNSGNDEICFYASSGHTYLLTVSSPEEAGFPTDQVLIRVDENDSSRVSKAVRLFGGRDYPSVLRKDAGGSIVYIASLSAGYTYASLIDYYTGENVTFTLTSEADLEDIFPIESLGEQAILTKEFPAYTCSAASDDKATLAFFKVRPTDSNWKKPWHIRYKLYVTTSAGECQGYYDCYISQQGNNLTYRVWNERYSPSYYPIYAHRVWWHNTQALWNNRESNPIRVGARVYSAYAANTLARTFKIEILEQYGCTVSFPNSIETRDSFYANTKYLDTSLDATTLGVTVTGDRNSNTLPTQLYDSYAGLLVHSGSVLYRYKVCGFDASGSLVPTTVTNQTSDTVIAKSASAVPMKVHKGLIYYSSTAAVSGTLRTAANTIYKYQGATSALPLYNFSANPGVNTDIYLKGSYNPHTDEFTLDTSSTTSFYKFIPQGSGSLNSASAFEVGAYYWYLGYKTSNATYMNFALDNPLYRYDRKDGIKQLIPVQFGESDVFVATYQTTFNEVESAVSAGKCVIFNDGNSIYQLVYIEDDGGTSPVYEFHFINVDSNYDGGHNSKISHLIIDTDDTWAYVDQTFAGNVYLASEGTDSSNYLVGTLQNGSHTVVLTKRDGQVYVLSKNSVTSSALFRSIDIQRDITGSYIQEFRVNNSTWGTSSRYYIGAIADMSALPNTPGEIRHKVGGYKIIMTSDSFNLYPSSTSSLGHWNEDETDKYISIDEFKSYGGLSDADIEALKQEALSKNRVELTAYDDVWDEHYVYLDYSPVDYGDDDFYVYRSDSSEYTCVELDWTPLDVFWDENDEPCYPVKLAETYIKAPTYQIDGMYTSTDAKRISRLAYCSTAANTAAKTGSLAYDMTFNKWNSDLRVTVNFSNKNTADNPKLRIYNPYTSSYYVDGDIYYNNVKITTGSWKGYLYGQVDLLYSGSRWNIVGVPPAALEDTVGNLETLLAAI